MKNYYINLSQISTFTKYIFQIITFKSTSLSNNRVPSLNKGTLGVNILDCKFVSLIIKKHSEFFVKIATLVQKLPRGVKSLSVNKPTK